jgi:hypothetical protein
MGSWTRSVKGWQLQYNFKPRRITSAKLIVSLAKNKNNVENLSNHLYFLT